MSGDDEFGHPGDGRGPELAARYLADQGRASEQQPRPRPRLRVLHAAEGPPWFVLDRWPAGREPLDIDASELGVAGVLAFPMDIDLDDDGLGAEPPALIAARDTVMVRARKVARLHDAGLETAPACEHLAAALSEYDDTECEVRR